MERENYIFYDENTDTEKVIAMTKENADIIQTFFHRVDLWNFNLIKADEYDGNVL